MRVLFLGNNWLGWQVGRWLRAQGEEIAGLVAHPPERRQYGEELVRDAGLGPERIFDGARLREADTLAAIEALGAEIAVSVMFGYLLRPELLALFPRGAINLHPAYLPYNRGAYPNVWSIVEGTPAGVTLHYIDPGVDTGDLIGRQEVAVEPTDTG